MRRSIPPAVRYPDPMSPSPAPASVYVLPPLPYARLRFTLRATEPSTLPPFKGSLLRGAFGHALRRVACAMGPEQPCETCRLRAVCVYTRVFETYIEGEPPPFLQGLTDAPRPYVFEPGTEALAFAPGAALPFDLLLIGRAIEHLPYVLLAVERMAAAGLGSRRHPFALDRVDAQTPEGWQPIFVDGRAQGRPLPPLFPSEDIPADRALLRFLTPTRLKAKGQLQASVDFRGLAFAMLRRVLELAWFHVPGADIDWTFRPLLERASTVKVRASDLAWKDWQRYSNRQERSMTLGGFVGTMEIKGDLAPFGLLLRTAEIVHLGKGATFGMGWMELEP